MVQNMRYLGCPNGCANGNDDAILLQEIASMEYNASEIVIREIRKCDICLKTYQILIHYRFSYETYDDQ